MWDARYDLPAARKTNSEGKIEFIEPIVSCVVSIGASYYPAVMPIGEGNLVDVIFRAVGFATNTDAKHWDFMGNNIRRNVRLPEQEQTKYFRYNAKASKDINLDDYQQMHLLEQDTVAYLDSFEKKRNADGLEMSGAELENHIDRCAQELAHTQRV